MHYLRNLLKSVPANDRKVHVCKVHERGEGGEEETETEAGGGSRRWGEGVSETGMRER